MPELRWTLLIIGVLFVVILAWWERRRPHQASRQAPHISGEPRPVVNDDPSWAPDIASANPRIIREPTLTLPEIHTEARTREPMAPRELPVFEIPEDSIVGLRADDDASVIEKAVAAEEALEEEEAEEEDEEEAAVPRLESIPVVEPAELQNAAPEKTPELPPPPATPPAKPIVDWPPEDQRKLVALRLVARPPDRFRGNLIRQALAAEGFVLGDLDIFHKPDAQNRAVISAASLTKPGTFDLETMDTQRFVGLNLFTVLPGPKSSRKAFEDLLLTARMLNERLEGALQDDRGGPLTPTRIQALRDALETEAKS
jgi:cell division protein ZipA